MPPGHGRGLQQDFTAWVRCLEVDQLTAATGIPGSTKHPRGQECYGSMGCQPQQSAVNPTNVTQAATSLNNLGPPGNSAACAEAEKRRVDKKRLMPETPARPGVSCTGPKIDTQKMPGSPEKRENPEMPVLPVQETCKHLSQPLVSIHTAPKPATSHWQQDQSPSHSEVAQKLAQGQGL